MKNFVISMLSALLFVERLFISCETWVKVGAFITFAIFVWVAIVEIEELERKNRIRRRKIAATKKQIRNLVLIDLKKAE